MLKRKTHLDQRATHYCWYTGVSVGDDDDEFIALDESRLTVNLTSEIRGTLMTNVLM